MKRKLERKKINQEKNEFKEFFSTKEEQKKNLGEQFEKWQSIMRAKTGV